MSSLIGQTLGHYRIVALLGTGSMGQVFRAQHVQTGRPVAVKVLNTETFNSLRSRLPQEMRVVSALEHANIVRLFEYGEKQGYYYLVHEYVSDGSVRGLLQRRNEQKRPRLTEDLNLVYQATRALAHAHQRGVLHCDIKPDNLLLAREGEGYLVKVSDFGLARLAQSGAMTATGIVLGTPAYVSPEQSQGLDPDPRSDIYSLGVVLYELATGYLPFDANTPSEAVYKHVHTPPIPPRRVRSDLPQRLEDIILRCLAKRPAERFQTAENLGQALADFDSGAAVLPSQKQAMPVHNEDATAVFSNTPPPPPKPPRSSGRLPIVRVYDENGQLLQTLEVPKEVRIGRHDDNDVVLPAGIVSGKHARLDWDGSRVTVVDLKSSNGTLLEKTKLLPNTPQVWSPGESVYIGSYRLAVEYQTVAADDDKTSIQVGRSATPEPDHTVIDTGRPPEKPRREKAVDVVAEKTPGVRAPRLNTQDKAGHVIQTQDLNRVVVIGRDPECDIVLPAGVVSLRHARVEWDGSRITVTDLKSSNGTVLDETRLLPNAPQVWQPGQVLHIGTYTFGVEMPEKEPVVEPAKPSAPVQSERINIMLDPTTLTLTPGIPAVIRVTLANLGQTVDHFSVEVDGAPKHWVTGPAQPPQLYPGAQAVVPLTILAPRESNSLAGEYPVEIRAHSKDRAWEFGTASAIWTVLPFESSTFSMSPLRAGGHTKAKFKVALHNQGNTPIDYQIRAEDEEQSLQFDVPQTHLVAKPGETATLSLDALGSRRWLGNAQIKPIKITAIPSGKGAIQSAAAQFVHKAILPPWAPPLGLLAFLGLFFLLWKIITAPPTIQNVTLDPPNPFTGQPVTVRWEVSNAREVVFQPLGEVVDADQGTFTFKNGFQDPLTLTLVARNRYKKTAEKALTIPVVPPPAAEPIIEEWNISSNRVIQGQPVELRWRVSQAEDVTIQPFGTESLQGIREDVPLQPKVYTLIARNRDKVVQRSLEVFVETRVNAPQIGRFSVEPNAMLEGEHKTVRLVWDTRGATSVSIEPGIGSVGPKGSREVPAPSFTTTYELLASNDGGEQTSRATVTIKDALGGVFAVKGVTARVSPVESTECPATFTFFGTVTSNARGTVTYQWERSDGAEPEVQSINFDAPGSKVVRSTWTIGAPITKFSGFQQLKVLTPTPATSDPASFTVNCAGVAGGTVAEACVSFNQDNLRIERVAGAGNNEKPFALADGTIRVKRFASENEARQALNVYKQFDMNLACSIGRPNPSMEYYLASGAAPTGSFQGERCASFNAARLKVRQEKRWIILDGKRWFIQNGDRRLFSFSNEADARTALAIIQKHGFTQACSVGPEKASLSYMRK